MRELFGFGRLLGFGLIVYAGAGAAGAEVTLYSQPTVTDPNLVGNCFYSNSRQMSSRNYKHADDFLVAGGGEIQRVRWWGLTEGVWGKTLANVSQFTIEFYAATPSSGGLQIGSLLATSSYALALTSQTATGRVNPHNQAIEYQHEVTLTTPMHVDAGTPYFIAVSARPINANRDAWGWQDGLLVNGYSQIYSYGAQSWSSFQDTDSAFELFGTAAPSPGAASVTLALGLSCAGRRRR